MLTPTGHGDLMVREATRRIERARIEPLRGGSGVGVQRAVQLHRSPARIAQRLERLSREHARDLVLAVAVAGGAGEHGHDDLGTEPAHHVEHVAQQRVAWPHPERFSNVLGVTEVVRPGEELAGPVDAASGEQLLRADHAQLGTELRADQVLAALAPAERQIGHLRPQPPREQRHEIRVLVVGVRADHQDPLGGPELAQGVRQRRNAAGAGRAVLPQGRADGAEKESEASPERAPHYGER